MLKKRATSLYLIIFFLDFCLGIGVFSYLQIFVDKWFILGFVLAIFSLFYFEGFWQYIFWGLLSFLLGWLYLSIWHLPPDFSSKENFKGTGFVIGSPDSFSHKILCPFKIEDKRVLLEICENEKIENFCLPGNSFYIEGSIENDLSAKEYLVGRFSAKIKVQKIQLVNLEPKGFFKIKLSFLRQLFEIREQFSQVLASLMRQSEANFAQGLVLGNKTNFSKDFKNKLAKTGTSHLVALSGFNISILIFASFDTLKFLSPIVGFFATTFFIISFVLMTGAASSVVRAAIVGIMLISGRVLGRQTDHLLILSLSLFLMMLLSPFSLVWDVGLQLSFTAFSGLIYFSPLLKEKLKFFGFLGEVAADTIGATIFTLPLVIYYFGAISIIALLANILIIAVIPITTYLVLFTGIFGLFSCFLGKILSYIAQVFLNYCLGIIEFFSQLSWAQIEINVFPATGVFIYYLIAGLIIWVLWQRKIKNENI